MEKTKEQVIRTNQEILDKLCIDMRIIAAYGNLSPALKCSEFSINLRLIGALLSVLSGKLRQSEESTTLGYRLVVVDSS